MENINGTSNYFEINPKGNSKLNLSELDRLKISLMLDEEDDDLVTLFHVLAKVGEWLNSEDMWIEDKYGNKVESARICYKPMTLLKRLVNLDGEDIDEDSNFIINPDSDNFH